MLAHLMVLAAILYLTRVKEAGVQPYSITIDMEEFTLNPGEVTPLYQKYDSSGYVTVTLGGDGTSGLAVIVRANGSEVSNPADIPNTLYVSFKSYLEISLTNTQQYTIKGFSPTIKITGVVA